MLNASAQGSPTVVMYMVASGLPIAGLEYLPTYLPSWIHIHYITLYYITLRYITVHGMTSSFWMFFRSSILISILKQYMEIKYGVAIAFCPDVKKRCFESVPNEGLKLVWNWSETPSEPPIATWVGTRFCPEKRQFLLFSGHQLIQL